MASAATKSAQTTQTFRTDTAKPKNNGRSRSPKRKKQADELPSIAERLANLRPSRELLEHYREKIAQYDEEHEVLTKKLDDCMALCEKQHKLEWQLQQRSDEIAALQKALSDIQVHLFQEREHVLRLYADNDKLRIREAEDRKRIQQLLSLAGAEEDEVTYLMQVPTKMPPMPEMYPDSLRHQLLADQADKKSTKASRAKRNKRPSSVDSEKFKLQNDTLSLQVEALYAQLDEQTSLAHDQVQALLDDRRVLMDEADAMRCRDVAQIEELTSRLQKTEGLLHESTRDYLQLKYQGRAEERQWMSEKEVLLRELDRYRQAVSIFAFLGTQELEKQLRQSNKLCEMYREQCVALEDQLCGCREKADAQEVMFKARSEKIGERLELMQRRYKELERRRLLEAEGFKTDIRMLRSKLKDLERQLLKVAVGNFHTEDRDLEIL
ncbi:PREDICTED: coiled-coil domain-containing protein 77-like, partial [Priapulus caudatus]|uniref:Coiled-coil domain-containing protein 77-like n=1 Tax=Priapulus caudatus TaxID=37621 RepID=A0ABM1EU86_PRICU